MKLRKHANAKKRLEQRQARWDKDSLENKRCTKRPGSMNPKKGN